ncbi:MAG: biosynthetic arginine decarboxylase [Candidatus Eutrophobiaceae bacterium]
MNAPWSIAQARRLYRLEHWAAGYFDIGSHGHAEMRCGNQKADIYALAMQARQEGLSFPLLIRFMDILEQRISHLCETFNLAIAAQDYPGTHTLVYPIKVNQQRAIVECIAAHPARTGLEAGSKAELLAILALAQADNIVVCNGYKDAEYIRLALIGAQMGLKMHIVIEKPSETARIIHWVKEMAIKPLLGLRIRLDNMASGHWQNTGGTKSKFGLHSAQVLEAVALLKDAGLLGQLRLLHFHAGSQIPDLRDFKRIMLESAHYYASLRELGVPLRIMDVGGGLGIDYEGTQSTQHCSMNYSTRDYADAVVGIFKKVCGKTHPCPDLITESGRAVAAHHSVLVCNVVEQDASDMMLHNDIALTAEPQEAVLGLQALHAEYADAAEAWDLANTLLDKLRDQFMHGTITLPERALGESIYTRLCLRLLEDEALPECLHTTLRERLAHRYVCNFSVFQSIPDSWAIKQIFPIMPIHRLNERPNLLATLHDLTCDSDGRIERYVGECGLSNALPVHDSLGKPYLLGLFLLGAYQEVLGDVHNLFGTTSAVDVRLGADGDWLLQSLRHGEKVSDLLHLVDMDQQSMQYLFRERVSNIPEESRRQTALEQLYAGLASYPYMQDTESI